MAPAKPTGSYRENPHQIYRTLDGRVLHRCNRCWTEVYAFPGIHTKDGWGYVPMPQKIKHSDTCIYKEKF